MLRKLYELAPSLTVAALVLSASCKRQPKLDPDAKLFQDSLVSLIDKNRTLEPSDGTLKADERFFRLMSKDCAQNSTSLPAAPAILMSASKEFYESGSNVLKEVNAATHEFEDAGGLDFNVILGSPTQDSLAAHLVRLRKLTVALNALSDSETESEREFLAHIQTRQVPRRTRADAKRVFLKLTRSNLRNKRREADRIFMSAGIGALELLLENPGAWEITDRPSIRFHDEAARERWAEFMRQIVEANQKSRDADSAAPREAE